MWTFWDRREWLDHNNGYLRFKASTKKTKGLSWKWHEAHVELHNEHWDNYNYSKNKLLLESFCLNTDVRLFSLNVLDIDSQFNE